MQSHMRELAGNASAYWRKHASNKIQSLVIVIEYQIVKDVWLDSVKLTKINDRTEGQIGEGSETNLSFLLYFPKKKKTHLLSISCQHDFSFWLRDFSPITYITVIYHQYTIQRKHEINKLNKHTKEWSTITGYPLEISYYRT